MCVKDYRTFSKKSLFFFFSPIFKIFIFSLLFSSFNNLWLLNLRSFLVGQTHDSSPLDFFLLVRISLSCPKQNRNNPSEVFPKMEQNRRFVFCILQVVFSLTYPRMCFLQHKGSSYLFPDWISRSFPENPLPTQLFYILHLYRFFPAF